MNDRKFLDLLNLYLDGEIAPEDRAAFEYEVCTNPDRHRVYSEYCRIHRATRIVCERFRSPEVEAASEGAVHAVRSAVGGGNITPFFGARKNGRRNLARAAVWAAAAAACAVAAATFLIVQTPEEPAAGSAAILAAGTPQPAVGEGSLESPPMRRIPAAVFPAPLAPQLRPDPYVMQFQGQRPNGFVDPNWPMQLAVPEMKLTPVNLTPGRLDPSFGPTSIDFFEPFAEPAPRGTIEIFREYSSGQPSQLQPVGFELQR